MTGTNKKTPYPLLNPKLWSFSLRSLFKEYGTEFILKIALPHPILFVKGIKNYIGSQDIPLKWKGGSRSIIGMGFCLKPLQPECLSGRFNHECHYLQANLHQKATPPPHCCRDCKIREIGLLALKSNSPFYIMTSARDILHDLLLPASKKNTFSQAILGLCRYSVEPFKIALAVCSIDADFFPFEKGDCQDYKTWRRADKGIKEEQTCFFDKDLKTITAILSNCPVKSDQKSKFRKIGNTFFCVDQ